jgi:large subunit ribosomal protein L22
MIKVSATAKSVRVSTRKVRLVADAIRNMSAKDALASLTLIDKRGAGVLSKTIKSAVANAVNNAKLAEEDLIIDALQVLESPFLKRFRPSTRGRVHPYKKRGSHITVVLRTKEEKPEVKKEIKPSSAKDTEGKKEEVKK